VRVRERSDARALSARTRPLTDACAAACPLRACALSLLLLSSRCFIFVGFNGAFATRADVERFIFERMGFAGATEDLVRVDRDLSRVWLRALANIARGTSPPLLRRTAEPGDVESLMVFCNAPFSEALFWPEHARSDGEGAGNGEGAGAGAVAAMPEAAASLPRSIGRQANGEPLELRAVLAAHRVFDAADAPRLAQLHGAAMRAIVGQSPPLQDPPARFAELVASFEAGLPEGAVSGPRDRCERALAALWLLQLPLSPLPPLPPLPADSCGVGGRTGLAAARARLELRRHALFVRVLALLRGDEDHAPLWREMLAALAPRAAPRGARPA
jgi:hypothetical protein